ncbi:MAG: FAD-dependent oxidoreductase [Patescibacteria group bacterium]
MKKLYTETLIIGAGPAGLACALELAQHKKDFMVIERDLLVGGLSKTYSFAEDDGSVFYTDNGPHRFFSKDPYLYQYLGDILKEDWIMVSRHTRQYIEGAFYDYPINAIQALRNIGVVRSTGMAMSYCFARIKYGLFKRPIRNFKEYIIANFGKSLGEFSMINYTEKIWGIDSSHIHPDWARQRIKGLNVGTVLKSVVSKMRKKNTEGPKSLIDSFYYPRKGTGQIYTTIQDRLIKAGYSVYTGTWPVSVVKTNEGFRTQLINVHGESLEVCSRYLVESVPIVEFLKLMIPEPPGAIISASAHLRYRSQVYLFVTLNKDFVTNDQWIYFPSKDIPIGRVSEMKNFSSYMSPPTKTSLFIELFCFEGDTIWNMGEQDLFDYVLPYCESVGLFMKKEVRRYYRIAQKNVYPIYDLPYQTYLAMIKRHLDTIPDLFYIGRPGRFRYNNQDHSLEMGMLAAKSIIDGIKYDIESVGEEKEYFESGKLHYKNKING